MYGVGSMDIDLDLLTAILLVVGGFAAGFINAVAGGGSAITLPVLVELLGDAVLANGTNRIAILLQNVSGVTRFQRSGKVPWKDLRPLILPTLIGALVGAWLATLVEPEVMERVFGIVVLLVALSVVFKPSRWEGDGVNRLRGPLRFVVFLALGLYGGFVQAGVGFLFIAALVVYGGMDLVTGNAAKLTLIAVYTAFALGTFIWAGQVNFLAGFVLAAGNMTGAWVAAHVAVEKGAGWIRWVLFAAASIAAVRMLF
jgi:uncharacterized membrane protein YfcA